MANCWNPCSCIQNLDQRWSSELNTCYSKMVKDSNPRCADHFVGRSQLAIIQLITHLTYRDHMSFCTITSFESWLWVLRSCSGPQWLWVYAQLSLVLNPNGQRNPNSGSHWQESFIVKLKASSHVCIICITIWLSRYTHYVRVMIMNTVGDSS